MKLLRIMILGLAIILVGCGEKETMPGYPIEGNELKLGNSKTYNIDTNKDFDIVDEISKLTINFPNGGKGDLIVTEIIKNEQTPNKGAGFQIKFNGIQKVQIKFDVSDGNYLNVFGYGQNNGCGNFESEFGWVPLPVKIEDGKEIVFLPISNGMHKTTDDPKITNNYWYEKYEKATSDAEKRMNLSLQILSYKNSFVDMLSSSMQSTIKNRIKDLPLIETISVKAGIKGANFYNPHFNRHWYSGDKEASRGELSVNNPTLGTIAHELGHYMHHVFVGDDNFKTIFNSAKSAGIIADKWYGGHAIGMMWDRNTILEDFAYLSEQMLTNSVGGLYSFEDVGYPAGGPFSENTVLGGKNKTEIDFPSLEGFTTALLTYLHVGNGTGADFRMVNTVPIHNWSRSKLQQPVPVVGVSWGDIYEKIIFKGATNISELKNHIELFLKSRNESAKFPVIAERIGWSYSIKGKVVDSKGKAIVGAYVLPIAKANGKTYYTQKSLLPSNKDGKFECRRAFFGNSYLRVYFNKDSVDVPINIDSNKPTNETIDLGNIKVNLDNKILEILKSTKYLTCLIEAEFVMNDGTSNNDITVSNRSLTFSLNSPIVWNGNNFSLSDFDDFGSSSYQSTKIEIKGSVNIMENTISFSAIQIDSVYNFSGGSNYSTFSSRAEMSVQNLPIAYSAKSVGAEFRYTGANIANNFVTNALWTVITTEHDSQGTTVTKKTTNNVKWNSSSSASINFGIY